MRRTLEVTPAEAAALLMEQVAAFETAGLSREAAVLAAALTVRPEPQRIVVLSVRPADTDASCSG